jgi:2-acylglycerol O-acyltransferase 2
MPASDIGSSVSYTEYSEQKRDYTKMEEFLQAVGVWWCFTHTFGAMIGIPFLCLLGIILMPKLTIAILAPYSIWYLYDRESSLVGKPSELIKYYCRYAWHWKMFREYASAKLVKTSDLDPSRNYLSCFHPHGIS